MLYNLCNNIIMPEIFMSIFRISRARAVHMRMRNTMTLVPQWKHYRSGLQELYIDVTCMGLNGRKEARLVFHLCANANHESVDWLWTMKFVLSIVFDHEADVSRSA